MSALMQSLPAERTIGSLETDTSTTYASSSSKIVSSIAAGSFPSHSLAFKDNASAKGKVPLVTMRTISETESRKNRKKTHSKDVPKASTKKPSSGSENTGRWTSEEHQLFLDGLDAYGKEWKRIAELIKTRTVVQIRTHAQKYFQKVAKAREQANEKIPATFRSTAMNTKTSKVKSASSTGTSKKRKSASKKTSSQASKRQRVRAKGTTKKTRKVKSVKDSMVSFKINLGTTEVEDDLSDPLAIRLDLFRNTQPLPFQFEPPNNSLKIGGSSPTTAAVDLFAPENFEGEPTTAGIGSLDFLDADIDGYDFEDHVDETSDTGADTCNSGDTTPSGSPLPLSFRGRTDTNNQYPKKQPLAEADIKLASKYPSVPIPLSAPSSTAMPSLVDDKHAIKSIKLNDGSPSLSAIDLPIALRGNLLEPLTRPVPAHCLNSLPTPAGAGIMRRAGGTRHSQFRVEASDDEESFISGLLSM